MEPDWGALWQRLLDSIEHGFQDMEARAMNALQNADKLPALMGKAGGRAATGAMDFASALGGAGSSALDKLGGWLGKLGEGASAAVDSVGSLVDKLGKLPSAGTMLGKMLDVASGMPGPPDTKASGRAVTEAKKHLDTAQTAMNTAFPGPALDAAIKQFHGASKAHREALTQHQEASNPANRVGKRLEQLQSLAPTGSSIDAGLKMGQGGARIASGDVAGGIKDIFKAVAEEGKNRVKAVGNMLQSERGEDVVGAGARALGIPFVDSIMKAEGKLREFADQLHESNMKFAEFSGAMAGVQARQYVRDIQYSMRRGNARAPGAERLEQARSNYREAWAPFEDAWADFKNNLFANLLEMIKPIAQAVSEIARRFGLNTPDNDLGQQLESERFLMGMVDRELRDHGLPQRWNRNPAPQRPRGAN